MNFPIQAAPVMRGQARAAQFRSLTQQGCNPFTCGAAVITCAAACINSLGAACIACLGSSYDACKDYF